MSSHHTRKTILKHYQTEQAAIDRRNEAYLARQEMFEATREAARKAGLAVQRELRWLKISEVAWGVSWLAAIFAITLTALRMLS